MRKVLSSKLRAPQYYVDDIPPLPDIVRSANVRHVIKTYLPRFYVLYTSIKENRLHSPCDVLKGGRTGGGSHCTVIFGFGVLYCSAVLYSDRDVLLVAEKNVVNQLGELRLQPELRAVESNITL